MQTRTRKPPARRLALAEVLNDVAVLTDEVTGRSMLLMGGRHNEREVLPLAQAAVLALEALRDALPAIPEGPSDG